MHYSAHHGAVAEVEPETWAVMAGRGAPGAGAPLNVPPVLASNFELGAERAYSRDDATPTWEAFEELLGGLERGDAVAFASGMGAIAAVFDLLPVGATGSSPTTATRASRAWPQPACGRADGA